MGLPAMAAACGTAEAGGPPHLHACVSCIKQLLLVAAHQHTSTPCHPPAFPPRSTSSWPSLLAWCTCGEGLNLWAAPTVADKVTGGQRQQPQAGMGCPLLAAAPG